VKIDSVKAGAFALLAILPNVPGDVFPHAATSNTVLFDREIVRLLDEHCVMCHFDGGVSFPLETYEQAWLARREIHDAILSRHMPPWGAVPGYGEFVNANRLTLRETRFIVSWVEGLGPRNAGEVFLNVQSAGARTEIRAGVDLSTWRIGEPDVRLEVPEPVVDPAGGADADAGTSGAEGELNVVRSVIDTGLDAETGLRALEYHPGDYAHLRAVVFSLETSGQWLATWTPWHGFRELPGDAAIRLPAAAHIVADFYLDEDSPAFDAGELGLRFSSAPPSAVVADLRLEAGAPASVSAGGQQGLRQRFEARRSLDRDFNLLALWPVLPADTQSIEVHARAPGGRIEILLSALDPPADWPTSYLLDEPRRLTAGTELRFIVYRAGEGAESAASTARLVLSGY
jgi:mono/diheme cytochrome c family protein